MAVSDGMGAMPDSTSVQKREFHRQYGAGRHSLCAGRLRFGVGRHVCGAGRHDPPVTINVKVHNGVGRHGLCAGRHSRRGCEIIFLI